MKVTFTAGTVRKEFDVPSEATVADVLRNIGEELLTRRCIYLNGTLIDAYENIVDDPGLMNLRISGFSDSDASHCYVVAILNGWLRPPRSDGVFSALDDHSPWRKGFYGRCPCCGKTNKGMLYKPTSFCPHCGKRVC